MTERILQLITQLRNTADALETAVNSKEGDFHHALVMANTMVATPVYVEDLDIAHQSKLALIANGISTVAQLVQISKLELLRLRNCGPVKVDDIVKGLRKVGLTLRVHSPFPGTI